MSRRSIQWLYAELPSLVKDGVVSEDAAARLHGHYGEVKARSGVGIALILCSILGSLLIGSGIILLLAHNWTSMPRVVRTVLCFLPLVAGQAIGLWGVARGRSSTGWREGVGTFIFVAIGSSIALIGQTYHIPGDLGSFLLVWMIVALPLVYVLSATVPATLYIIGITSWACVEQCGASHAAWFWPLFLLVCPYILSVWRRNRYGVRAALLGWVTGLSLCVAFGVSLEKVLPGLWIPGYLTLFALFYLVGVFFHPQASGVGQNPLKAIGAVGSCLLALALTYSEPWDDIGWFYYRHRAGYHELTAWIDYVLIGTLLVCAMLLLLRAVREKRLVAICFGLCPWLAALGYGLAALFESSIIPVLLFNPFCLAFGIILVVSGVRRLSIGVVNGGMLVITGLITARFFDADMGLILRGIVFIVIGAGFLTANVLIMRRAKMRGEK